MQDKGYLLVNVQLPDAASVERTKSVMHRIERIARATKTTAASKHTRGRSPGNRSCWAPTPRTSAPCTSCSTTSTAGPAADCPATPSPPSCRAISSDEINDGVVSVFGAPPVDGLGTAGGFKIMIEDRGDNGLDALAGRRRKRSSTPGSRTRELQDLFTSFRADTPWLFLDIDRAQAKTLGISMADIFDTLQVFLGSLYVNDFNCFGRTWQVNVQADANFRRQIEDIKQLKVRNAAGTMVPLGTVMPASARSAAR